MPKTVADIIDDSGYPLQLHLESQVDSTRSKHGWRVLAKEHRWVNAASGEEGFIDLVLEHSVMNVRLIVECKRIDGSWTFLLPETRPAETKDARILQAQRDSPVRVWVRQVIQPGSYESAFCVLETGGKKDSRTLEKLSGEVLLSAECLAAEEMKWWQEAEGAYRPSSMFYLPVAVTTAQLQTCTFAPGDVDVADGRIGDRGSIVPIDYIRFCKNLASGLLYERPNIVDLRSSNMDNNRTIFVVQATHFMAFLTRFGKLK